MRISRDQLRQIIKEEIEGIINEEDKALSAEDALKQIVGKNGKMPASKQGQGAAMLSAVLAMHGAKKAVDALGGEHGLMAMYDLAVSDEQKAALDL